MPKRWTIARARAAFGEVSYQVALVSDSLDSMRRAFPSDAEEGDFAELEVTAEFAAESLRSTATVLERASLLTDRRPELPANGWVESDSIRETTLICLDKRRDRRALRRVGRLLYNLAVEAGRFKAGESATVEELRVGGERHFEH